MKEKSSFKPLIFTTKYAKVANQSDCFLLPVLDLVNHESMPNATVKCSFNENWVELRATR